MADAVFIQRRRQDGLVAGGRLPGQAAPGGDPGGQGNDAPRQGQPGEQSLRRQGLGRLLKGDHQGGGALPVLRSVRPGRGLLHSLGLRPAVRRGHHPHRQALPAPGGRKEKAALVNTWPRLQVRPCVYPAKKMPPARQTLRRRHSCRFYFSCCSVSSPPISSCRCWFSK